MAKTNIATQIERIQTDRNTIRTKLINLGLADSATNLDGCATAIAGIENRGSVSATVQEGDTYTIPKGYHNGSGTVSGVAGGGNYNLQSKTITPTKAQQNITPDSGYYGLSDVTVNSIPVAFQDVTSVTATADDVLAGKVIVSSDGSVKAGVMTNNGAVSKTLDTTTTSYTVPKGYHSGTGKVSVTTEAKTATPTKSKQTISPTTGKVLSSVTVNPIPDEYITTGDATATAGNILATKTAYANGEKITGTMPNNGSVIQTLTTDAKTYTIPEGYHDGAGVVSIETQTKAVTPNDENQIIKADEGYVLSGVKVVPVPPFYVKIADATAQPEHILEGKKAGIAESPSVGVMAEGTMPNNGAVSLTIDGLTTTSVTIPTGYTSGGTVSLTNEIETALASI